jgi:hypothetical protein
VYRCIVKEPNRRFTTRVFFFCSGMCLLSSSVYAQCHAARVVGF